MTMLELGRGEFAPLQKRFRAYPHYKDSCVEWLGKIPAHWEIMPLKRLCARSALYGANEPADTYIDKGVRFLRTTDISDQGDLVGDGVYLPIEAISDYLLQTGDLLFSRSGTIGRSFLYDQEKDGPCAYAGYLVRFVPGPEFFPLFGFYLTKSLHFEHWAATAVISSTIGNVNAYKYANMPCSKPPLTEQIEISSFLDRETAKIDALIEKKERLIELLQEKRTALITQAVTKGLNPTVPRKDSGVEWLGEIPVHWEGAKMWRISWAISGGTPSKDERGYWDGDIPWVSPKDMKQRFIDSSEDTITERAIAETGIKLIAPPVVLIVVRGMILAHSFPVAITTVPVTINQDMKSLILRNGIDPVFMAWVFEGVGKSLLAAIVEEAAHGTKVIRMDQWRTVTVPVPPDPEQRAIVTFLDGETAKIDALISRIYEAIARLKEYRVALVTAAVTGKVDVTRGALRF